MGVTKKIEFGEPAPEGAKVDLYPFNALRFYGGFPVDDEALLTDYAVVLLGEGGEKFGFNLGYTVNRGDAIRVNLNRWVSLKELPVDTYTIYFVMNDQAYDVGCSVHIE